MKSTLNAQPAQVQPVAFTSQAEFEKAVLERLAALLPHTVHEAVHACLVKAGKAPRKMKDRRTVERRMAA